LIELAISNGVAIATMDRAPVNAIDDGQLRRLMDVLQAVRVREDLHALVLVGRGRAFCGGADIGMMRKAVHAGAHDKVIEFSALVQEAHNTLEALPLVTIAAMQGHATGGGLELALACDLRIAGKQTRMGLTEVTLGLIPAGGGTQRLARLVGPGTASRLILTGALIEGEEAAACGLVQWCVPNDEVESFALRVAGDLRRLPKSALVAAKRCIAAAYGDRASGYALELAHEARLYRDPRSVQCMTDFLDRRKGVTS